jgi:YggT family protein
MYQFDFWNLLADVLNLSLWLYFWVVMIAVIVSWVPLDPTHPTARSVLNFLRRATEPTFQFFRRTLRLSRNRALSAFAPVFVLLTISFLRIFLVQTIRDMALIGNPMLFLRCVSSSFLYAILLTIAEILGMYLWIVIIALIISFLPLDPYNPFAQVIVNVLRQATEPIYRVLRRTLQLRQYIKKVDFISPLIVIATIFLTQTLIQQLMEMSLRLRP